MEITVDASALPALAVTVKGTFILDPLVNTDIPLSTLDGTYTEASLCGVFLKEGTAVAIGRGSKATLNVKRQSIELTHTAIKRTRMTAQYTTLHTAKTVITGSTVAYHAQITLPIPMHKLCRAARLTVEAPREVQFDMPFGPPEGMFVDPRTNVCSGAVLSTYQQATLHFTTHVGHTKWSTAVVGKALLWRQEAFTVPPPLPDTDEDAAWMATLPAIRNSLSIVNMSLDVHDDFIAYVVQPCVRDYVMLREAWVSDCNTFRRSVIVQQTKAAVVLLQSSKLSRPVMFQLLSLLRDTAAVAAFNTLAVDAFPVADTFRLAWNRVPEEWFVVKKQESKYTGGANIAALTSWALRQLPVGLLPATESMGDCVVTLLSNHAVRVDKPTHVDAPTVRTASLALTKCVPLSMKSHLVTFSAPTDTAAVSGLPSLVHVWLANVPEKMLPQRMFGGVFFASTPYLLAGARASRSKRLWLSMMLGVQPDTQPVALLSGGDVVARWKHRVTALPSGGMCIEWEGKAPSRELVVRQKDGQRAVLTPLMVERLLARALTSVHEDAMLQPITTQRILHRSVGRQSMSVLMMMAPTTPGTDMSPQALKDYAAPSELFGKLAARLDIDVDFEKASQEDMVATFIANQAAFVMMYGDAVFCSLLHFMHGIVTGGNVSLTKGKNLLCQDDNETAARIV